MALARGDEFQGAATVNFVVPALEPGDPLAGLVKSTEGLLGNAGMVFEGLEQGD